jgi:DNA-binding HxlR family transcriptional regulator
MPAKTDLSKFNCSLAQALAAVGEGWTLLILRDAFLGLSRFGEFQQSLGMAKNILAARLAHLVSHGILERDGTEKRPLYRVTDKGRDLFPALAALMQWGDRWTSGGKAPMRLIDENGHAIARIRLATRRGPVDPRDISFRPGPGATLRTRHFMTRLSG